MSRMALPDFELSFSESMYGWWRPEPGGGHGEHAFSFSVHARAPSLRQWLRDGRAALTGDVHAEGLAGKAPARGELVARPFRGRSIRYELSFSGNDGRRYRYTGEKRIRYRHPVRTWTTLPGQLQDDSGRVIGTSVVRFRLGDLLPFLATFRLRRAPAPAGSRA